MLRIEEFASSDNNDYRTAYQRLIAKPCTWKEIYGAAKLIEINIPRSSENQYSHLGVTFKQFWDSIDETTRNTYITATKIIWWQKLVIKSDFEENWLTKEDLIHNRFFSHFNFFRFNASKNLFTVVKTKLDLAKAHWKLAKYKHDLAPNSRSFKESLNNYVSDLKQLGEEKISFFEARLIELQKENECLKKGNLMYFGIECSNREISGKYHELYISACQSNMNAIQFKYFCNILILKDFYQACSYLDKFETSL